MWFSFTGWTEIATHVTPENMDLNAVTVSPEKVEWIHLLQQLYWFKVPNGNRRSMGTLGLLRKHWRERGCGEYFQ